MQEANSALVNGGSDSRPVRARSSMLAALKAMARTLYALILREARIRHGRSRIGYAWAVLEPFAVVSVMVLFFNAIDRGGNGALAFPAFFASGLLPFSYFRHASGFIGSSLEANKPLFNYPTVREFDAVLARLLLDSATYLIIMTLVFSFLVIFLSADPPAHIGIMFVGFAGLGLLALGVGLNIAVLQRRFTMANYVYNMIMAPSFFLSCIFYSLESVPAQFRDVLVWNPIVHGVETFRVGFYAVYPDTYVSLSYLYLFGLVALFIGMVQLRLSRRGES